MLFEMLAGRPPFVASTAGDLIAMHITIPAPELGALAPSVSEAMAKLVRRMLAKLTAPRGLAKSDCADPPKRASQAGPI